MSIDFRGADQCSQSRLNPLISKISTIDQFSGAFSPPENKFLEGLMFYRRCFIYFSLFISMNAKSPRCVSRSVRNFAR